MSIIDLILKSDKENIQKLITDYDKDINEFEIALFGRWDTSKLLTSERFNNLQSILNKITLKNEEKYQMTHILTLDIILSVSLPVMTNYRITIEGIELINQYLNLLSNKKNSLIFKTLYDFIKKENNDKMKIIKKVKNTKNYVTIPDYYMRVKMDEELKIKKEEEKLINDLINNSSNIIFRLKDRYSYFITKYKNIFQVDLTKTKSTDSISKLDYGIINNEIEIECIINDKKTILTEAFIVSEYIIKIVQGSNNIISLSQTEKIIKKYHELFNTDKLYVNNVISLGINNVIDDLPNKYCVSDKADGNHFQLIVFDEKCYLINNNNVIKDTGIIVDKKFNNSVLDGELLLITKYNKYIFMVFDCLIIGNDNVMENYKLMIRLERADELINEINKTKYSYEIKNLDKNNMSEILNFHKNKIFELYDGIDKDLQKSNNSIIVRRKYFIEPYGINDTEVFNYSKLIWDCMTIDKNFKSLYLLDGLIYQPSNQKYILNPTLKNYKWKPQYKNSIDFYIIFEKNPITKLPILVYNNLDDEKERNKPYYICNLYVGSSRDGVENPILFNRDKSISQCYLYLSEDGFARSEDNKIINDLTVVEFYYDINGSKLSQERWIPIKTRFDKTESVMKYKKKYGNSSFVAKNIWITINNPILMDDFNELSDNEKYINYINILKKKINKETIIATEDAYYQKTKSVFKKEFGKFQNWVKSLVIYEYYNIYYNSRSYNVLDFAVGQGGDIEKYYYATVLKMVGIDIDKNGLFKTDGGAKIRYDMLKKRNRRYPPMFFIHSTPSNILTIEEQIKNPSIGKMTLDNIELFNKHLTKVKYDRLTCNFAIHYFFDTENTWNNYCDNINLFLREGGYFTFVTIDGNMLQDLLKKEDKIEKYYTYNGNKTKIYEIQKKYDDNDKSHFGKAVDIYMSWISNEGVYLTEYLVNPDFIINSLIEKCDMELIETLTFKEIYDNSLLYLNNASTFTTADEDHLKFINATLSFYNNNPELNDILREYSFLNRYYVFKKKEHNLKDIKNKYYTGKVVF